MNKFGIESVTKIIIRNSKGESITMDFDENNKLKGTESLDFENKNEENNK